MTGTYQSLLKWEISYLKEQPGLDVKIPATSNRIVSVSVAVLYDPRVQVQTWDGNLPTTRNYLLMSKQNIHLRELLPSWL